MVFRDPRFYQIAMLATLLGYGMVWLDFDITAGRAAMLLGVALLTQAACTRIWKLPSFDPRSALISGLSLCLLLRTNDPLLAVIGAVVTIASKFVLRVRGKHLFNPTNFGVVAMMLATGQVWVSPGQWGNAAFFGFLMACLGGLVVNRAARSDVTLAFIASYLTLVFARSFNLASRRDSDPPAPERRPPPLHVLHDFRSADDAEFAGWPRAVRRARRCRRLVHPVPAVPDERPSVVARRDVSARTAHRSSASGYALRLVTPDYRASAIEKG